MFGGAELTGAGGVQSVYVNDTWVYSDDTWTQLNPPTSPSARNLHVMAYDSHRDRVVLFSGYHGGGGCEGLPMDRETWEFDGTTVTQLAPTGTLPPARGRHAFAFDPNTNIFNGVAVYALNDDYAIMMARQAAAERNRCFGIVTSGTRVSDAEFERILEAIQMAWIEERE